MNIHVCYAFYNCDNNIIGMFDYLYYNARINLFSETRIFENIFSDNRPRHNL